MPWPTIHCDHGFNFGIRIITVGRTLVRERCRHRLRKNHRRVGSRSGKIMLDVSLKILQRLGVDVEFPLQLK
jgi:hypothetical protein